MAKTQHGRDLTGREIAEMLEEWSNQADDTDIRDFVEQITQRTHRTLQQRIMAALCQLLVAWSRQTNFDARNEKTITLAKQFVGGLDKYDLFLPLI